MKRQVLVAIVLIVAVTTALSATFLYLQPAFAGPVIDDTWLIAYNAANTIGDDLQSAKWVQAKYGGTLVDIGNDTINFNTWGQNLFIIGGSKSLALQAPWTGLDPTWYAVKQPDTYLGMQYYHDAQGNSHTITPKGTDYLKSCPNNDYGTITKGYDYTLRRWIIIVLGYSGYCTAYGAKLICTQYQTVTAPTYVVYKVTEWGGVNPATWTQDQFNGVLIEQG